MSTLESASKYLNNLLLARGLLQDGKLLDFAQPAYGNDGTDATMARIINLIHNLVLRQDRESDRNEAMIESVRTMRSAEAQYLLDIQHTQERNHQLKADIAMSQSQERVLRTSFKKLENQVKELKEQNAKMKSMVDQIRAKSLSDMRKKDIEIEKLRSHLAGVQRGRKETGSTKISKERRAGQNASKSDCALEQESNDFLAALIKETSTENVSLRQVVGDTLVVLKDMSGYEDKTDEEEDDGIGIPGQYRKSRQQDDGVIVPVESLADQMDTILGHCRTILKDPSFVPIEEVQVREEEIAKLRAGWERMADRWKEAVTMMSQWKQKITAEGMNVDVEGFSDLSFGRSVAVRPDGQPVLGQNHELSSIFEESRLEETQVTLSEAQDDEEPDVESDLELAPEPACKRLASSPARRGVRLPRPIQPLSEISTNSRTSSTMPLPSETSISSTRSNGENDTSEKLSVLQKIATVEAEAVIAEKKRQQAVTRKRKAQTGPVIGRKTSRRRSTLSPEELAELMGLS